METSFVPPAVCRICHSGDTSCAYNSSVPGEVLISPCLCKGTTGLYHRSCLERWLITSGTMNCEICQFVFDIHKKNRGFCSFLFNTESYFQRRNMLSDFVCFLILTPLAGLTCAICMKGIAELDYSSFKMQDIPNLLWLSGLIFLLIVTYAVWLIVTIIHHRRTFLEWQKYNQKLVVVDQLSEQESFLVNKCIMSLLGSMNSLREKFRVSMNATSDRHSHIHSSTVETGPEILATMHRPISRRFSSRYSHPELPCISELSDESPPPDYATVAYVTLLQSVNIHGGSQGNPV